VERSRGPGGLGVLGLRGPIGHWAAMNDRIGAGVDTRCPHVVDPAARRLATAGDGADGPNGCGKINQYRLPPEELNPATIPRVLAAAPR
jgi:hypothetical protein